MLPTNLKYMNKLESAYAKSYTTNIQPQNGMSGYTQGQTIIINIPTASNLVMASSESVLKFDLEVTSGAADNKYIRLDKCGAHLFQRLRLYHGSNLLEDLDNYSNLVGQLIPLMKGNACTSKDSILSGFTNEQDNNILYIYFLKLLIIQKFNKSDASNIWESK
jgi:hypothetical protein